MHKQDFPNFIKVADAVLVQPITAVACEQVFSSTARIKTFVRNRLRAPAVIITPLEMLDSPRKINFLDAHLGRKDAHQGPQMLWAEPLRTYVLMRAVLEKTCSQATAVMGWTRIASATVMMLGMP